MKKKFLSSLLVLLLMSTQLSLGLSVFVRAEETKIKYTDYRLEAEEYPTAKESLSLIPERTVYSSGDTESFTVNVPENAVYNLKLEYKSLKAQDIIVSLRVDGFFPFSEAEAITFPAMWQNTDDKPKTDKKGNQYVSEQILYEDIIVRSAINVLGCYERPYELALTAGEHLIRLDMIQGKAELGAVILSLPEQSAPYSPPTEQNKTNIEPIVIEGESASLKSARSLIPLSDSSNASLSPQSAVVKQLNYIGGSNWSKHGASLTWNINVAASGYYTLGFHYRQNKNLGGSSFRKLEIDGAVPFAEAERIRFTYDTSWEYMTWSDESDSPYQIYLEAGEHTITLSATAGPTAEVYSLMQQIAAQMGNLYVDMTMIVGDTVDVNRSYELFNQIPRFNERLDEIASLMETAIKKLQNMQKIKTGANISTLDSALRIVRTMRNKPYSAHRYKGEYYDAYTNLSALMGTMTDMPLDLDYFVLMNAVEEVDLLPTFKEKFMFSIKRFLSTFSEDYQAVADNNNENDEMKIWVMQGRDQALALNTLIQDGFVRNTGIPVKVELVNATLIQAMLSGVGPDCLLQMTRTEPVNLAMRGALVDLTQFGDLEEVLGQFTEGSEMPYRYQDGLYALPDTQSFFIMFLRTDILKALGIESPKTWDEFLHAAMLLQRNNLQVSMPSITDSGISNAGVGNMSLFPTLLVQNGLSLYRDDLSGTTLAEGRQAQVFSEWIQWYTKYKLPAVTDFFNRFRIGSAPIGIASYTLYTQLKAAAPEITGRWTVSQLPGTLLEDGTINHASASSGTGCAITKMAKNKENTWKFLKWWISTDTQIKYSEKLEAQLGPLGRVASANTEAVKSMDWDSEMLSVLINAKNSAVEIPEVPGGYYTARGIYQTYWSVLEQGNQPTDALSKWEKIVNREIARKIQQYADK